MSVKYYVLPEERKQMQEEAVKQAMISIEGPVGFYERWPGEEARMTITDDARQAWRPFCGLVCEDETRERLCRLDYEERAAACSEPTISLCWLGVHNLVCPVRDEHGGCVTLIGGEFRVSERIDEAQQHLEQFLEGLPPEKQSVFRDAWHQIPEVSEAEVLGSAMREMKSAGRSYLGALKRRSDFRYSADLVTHDVVIALQALIAEIEVLKIELKRSFGIGRAWEARFESLVNMCEDHYRYLETSLELDRPRYSYESLSKLVYECVDSYIPKARRHAIDFRVDLEQMTDEEGEHKVVSVRMDRIALRKALMNVIDNAVKYSFRGTAKQTRWIDVVGRLHEERGKAGYTIAVSNYGIGIEEDELELVLEPGYQGRLRIDEDRSGYGMGLHFVKRCVESHSGALAITSEPQRGGAWVTTVYIWLPIHGPTVLNSEV